MDQDIWFRNRYPWVMKPGIVLTVELDGSRYLLFRNRYPGVMKRGIVLTVEIDGSRYLWSGIDILE